MSKKENLESERIILFGKWTSETDSIWSLIFHADLLLNKHVGEKEDTCIYSLSSASCDSNYSEEIGVYINTLCEDFVCYDIVGLTNSLLSYYETVTGRNLVYKKFAKQNIKQITFEPIGDMDKPMPEIFIKNKPCEDKWYCFYLKQSDINFYGDFLLENYPFEKEHTICDAFPFGAYKVLIESSNSTKQFILNNSEDSYVFYNQQLHLFKEEKDLYSSILKTVYRLR